MSISEEAPHPPLLRLSRCVGRAIHNMAAHDFGLLVFHSMMLIHVALAQESVARTTALPLSAAGLGITASMLLLCRGEVLPRGRARAIIYRTMAIACVFCSYFEMRHVLPALRPVLLDSVLLAMDQALLGATPARLFEDWITPATTQWFAFFYYSYMWLLAFNLVGTAALDRDRRRLHEMLVGGAVIGLVGHFTYTLVPGVGPYAHLAFDKPIPDVFWWRQVKAVVDHAGAMLDIFPSLHTAFPTFFALHALRHRRAFPFRKLWPVSVFFALNIVISTMFLRWHYAVDVVAGLGLAVGAQRLAVRDARPGVRRVLSGRQPVFEEVRVGPERVRGAGPQNSG